MLALLSSQVGLKHLISSELCCVLYLIVHLNTTFMRLLVNEQVATSHNPPHQKAPYMSLVGEDCCWLYVLWLYLSR
jgi:hypothetical protein